MATAPKSLMEQAQELTAQNQVQPVTQEFDESKGVAGRVDSLTRQDSPLMRQAETRGLQAAASRGLTNSSLAAQASQEAVISAATPIASADAGLYQQQNLANQSARNNAGTVNAQIGATLGGQALGLENSNQQQERSLAESARQFNVSSGQQRQQLAQQQQQIDAQISQFAQRLGLDTQGLQLQRDQLSQQDRQFLDNLTMQREQLAQQQRQFDTNAGQNQQQIDNQASQYDRSLTEQQAQRAQQQQQFEAQQQFQAMQAGLDRENRTKLAEIEAANSAAINSNGTIAQSWQQMSVNIANIQNNSGMDEATKRTLIQNQMDSFAGFASFWKKATGGTIDVSDLLNFSLPPAPPPPPPAPALPPFPGDGINQFD